MKFEAKKVKDEIIYSIREWFDGQGKECKAVIGISGGKDSTIVAGLCVEALGRERVIGVLMPNGNQADYGDSKMVVDVLGIKHVTLNIDNIYDSVFDTYLSSCEIKSGTSSLCFKTTDDEETYFTFSKQSNINLAPRIRMALLYFTAQLEGMNGRVMNTSNLSEAYVGHSTRFGDSVGDYAPISKLTKTEVCLIGKELGLPDYLVDKVPSDGLTGMTDEEKLGFTYEELDSYIRCGYVENKEHKKLIDNLHKKNLFKQQPIKCYSPYEYWKHDDKKLLIVVDMQNDFITGSLANKDAETIIPKVKEKIAEYLKNGDHVWFTQDTHYDNTYLNTSEGKNLPIKHCINGTHGHEICDELQEFLEYNDPMMDIHPRIVDVFQKGTFGCNDIIDEFDSLWNKYNFIEIVGICTDICVISNALLIKNYINNNFLPIDVTVDSSCCAGTTIENHNAALLTMKNLQIIVK